ncbi:DNA repair protein RadA [candidate division WWE3 bacterium]|uniref:DNA repair protein RadA n=1 Tax=candidate division WWE3 bacterium TaxID=2053526 RepID=A0A7X9E7C5_UNCKA|nr:DNA repair protein RadA [candidate division WWE3 bacterium]
MSKFKTVYTCKNCGYTSYQWVGQCPGCNEWNSFVEDVISAKESKPGTTPLKSPCKLVKLSEVSSDPLRRISSGIEEFDRVLGGGFVPGQVVLLAGEPGIGKSTILTEISKNLKCLNILYVCGEESIDQVKVRAVRMNYAAENMLMLSETNVDAIVLAIEQNKNIGLVIIDSVQTLSSDELLGSPGSLVQVRGCTQMLTNVAKENGIPMVLVGHVTKEGVVAGPKVLEHIVDTVLYLEGDSQHLFRILRTNKNRFGPVSEVGIFEMEEGGIKEVKNPSDMFLKQRMANSAGSCVTVVMEGYRPLLFEIQALTVKTSFGYPRRTASGFSNTRLQVLVAILERRAGLNLGSLDVYLSVAGGFKINEYAADLAVCLAITSSVKDCPVKEGVAAFGECGLNGEIRRVTQQDKRSKEAVKLGYGEVISSDNTKNILEAVSKSISR